MNIYASCTNLLVFFPLFLTQQKLFSFHCQFNISSEKFFLFLLKFAFFVACFNIFWKLLVRVRISIAVTALVDTLELAILQVLSDLLMEGERYGLEEPAKFMTDFDKYGLEVVILDLIGENFVFSLSFSNCF